MIVFHLFACQPEFNLEKLTFTEPEGDPSEPIVAEENPEPPPPPEECPERVWSAIETSVDESCATPVEHGTFSPIREWEMFNYEEFPIYTVTWSTPMVGHFTDDNGDGILASGDIPDIAVIQFSSDGWYVNNPDGVLRLISGDGTTVHWTVGPTTFDGIDYSPFNISTPAIGDVDVDGMPDIAVMVRSSVGSCHVALYNHLGLMQWVNTDVTHACGWSQPALADIDSDGAPEVILGNKVYNGEDGTLQWAGTFGKGWAQSGEESFVIDIDKDGQQDLIAGNTIYNSDGSIRCTTGYTDGSPAVADLNGDGMGEMVITAQGFVFVFDHNCWLLNHWRHEDLSGNGGPPTIADYDGDGEPEIGIATKILYTVYEPDGTLNWYNFTDDGSSQTGSSVFDFDGDGYSEVVYGDEQTLWIMNGVDGDLRLIDQEHSSYTVHEYPVTIDVDGDNQVEIVVPDNLGIYVIGDYDQSWVDSREVWNQHSYFMNNINDDLSIPVYAEPNWPMYNTFRSSDTRENFGQGSSLPDAFPILVDTCEIECEQDLLQVVFQLGNSGLKTLDAGVPISLYAEVAGERVYLQTVTSDTPVVSGRTSPGISVEIDPGDIPEGKIWIVVDDDGNGSSVLNECEEGNNELLLSQGLCQ